MFDLKKLRQMQEQMQEQMGKTRKELAEQTVEAASGGGAVSVVMNGNQEVVSVKIKPEAVDTDDIEMLQDLVMAAMNAALEKSRDLQQNAMGKAAGFALPPGMNFPF